MRERDNLFHLKHKPVDNDMSRFIKNCLRNAQISRPTKKMVEETKPYLESAEIEDAADIESIQELNL